MRWVPTIIIAITTLFLFTSSGCISQTSSQSTPSIDLIGEEDNDFQYFEDALAIMNNGDDLGMAYKPYTIHSVIGKEVTPEGRAKTWVFAVNSDTMFYFVYTGNSYITMNWTEENPGPAINLQKILSPSELFQKHQSFFNALYSEKNQGINEIELSNGRYFIRGQKNDDVWEYGFDAADGRQIF